MSTPQEEFLGGHVEQAGQPPAPVLEVPNPAFVARQELGSTLTDLADTWAPGPAAAPWDRWPGPPQTEAPGVVPKLVRAGSVEVNTGERLPVLVPTLGEAHYVVGQPWLATPTRPEPIPRDTPLRQRKAAEAQAKHAHGEAEADRLGKLGVERTFAARVMRDLMVRTLASMAPGAVSLTVFDPTEKGARFQDFAPMNSAEHGQRFRVTPDLEVVLRNLEAHMDAMRQDGLRGALSQRALARRSGTIVRPYQMVALLGDGLRLNSSDAERLQKILLEGNACGVSVLLHGISVEPTLDTHSFIIHADGRAESTAAPLAFQVEPPAPRAIVSTVAYAAGRPSGRPTGPVDRTPEQLRPGASYRQTVDNAYRTYEHTRATVQRFEERHPLIQPNFIAEELLPSQTHYLEYMDAVAGQPRQIRADVRCLRSSDHTLLAKLQAWAAFKLLQAAPGSAGEVAANQAQQISYGGDAQRIISLYLPELIGVVAITARHGHERIPEQLRAYATQNLHEDPPAYIFQLVADAATRRGPGALTPHRAAAREAVRAHLEATYGPLPQSSRGNAVDPDVFKALIECEIVRLYGATKADGASDDLRALIAHRSRQRLDRVAAEQLPESAHPFRKACLEYAEQMTQTETTVGTAMRLASLLRRRREPQSGSSTPEPPKNR